MRLAAIDIGSNSVKLLVADRTADGLREVVTRIAMTRLSRGLGRRKSLDLEAMDRTLEALSEFRFLAEQKGAERVLAVGTAALRIAANARDFLLRCEYEAGLPVRVLSGREEARLSFRGGTSGLGPGAVAAIDIGGASTKVMLGIDGRLGNAWSLPMGVVTFTEEYLPGDPPRPQDVHRLLAAAGERLGKLPKYRGEARFVAIGGTATTMVSMMLRLRKISAARIHGRRFGLDTLRGSMWGLAGMTLRQRRNVAGLEPARADVIVAGLAILDAAATRFGFDVVRASARGLRHGVLLDSNLI